MAESTAVVSFAVGLLAVILVCKFIKLSVKLMLNFVSNSIVGMLIFFILNLLGAELTVTTGKAILIGLFGIPAVIGVLIWDKLL